MQITQSTNDTINIVFDPNVDGLCLLDFILVEEGRERFLAQIVEISNDKFDANQNLATIKILYSINTNDEIIPYNGFTPNKTCKITLYNQREIEEFINTGKESFPLMLNPKTMLPLDVSKDFFSNNPVILADKIDDSNVLIGNLSQALSEFKNVVVFDYTGSLNIKNASRLRACVDFRIPLDFYSIDAIWEESMQKASLETQAVCEEIFNAIKAYSKTAENKFVPFQQLLKVIQDQYEATPIKELLVLKNRLIKYQQSKIFARNIKDIEIVSGIIKQDKIVIIDFSALSVKWHKFVCDFILRTVKENAYLFVRLNEDNSDIDLINRIYTTNKRLKVIPSISYGYKKISSLIEYCKNYIFLPTLNVNRNYGYINSVIWTLNQNYALLYGEDTKNFIFEVQNTINVAETIKIEKKNPDAIKLKGLKKDSEKVGSKEESLPSTRGEREDLVNLADLGDLQKELNEQTKVEDAKNLFYEYFPKKTGREFEKDFQDILDSDVAIEPEPETAVYEPETPFIFEEEPALFDTQEVSEEQDSENNAPSDGLFEDEEFEEEIEEAVQSNNDIVDMIGDDELDFYENVKSNEFQEVNYEEQASTVIDKTITEDGDLSLEELADQSLDETFNEVVEEEPLLPDDNVIVTKVEEEKDDIPIYTTDENEPSETQNFKEGDSVIHEKYGVGKVLKVVKYSNRCLLQIEFDQIGKRLLDPKIAKIKLNEQQN